MSSVRKVKKKKKAVKHEVKKELPPQVVTRQLADNTYSGIIREGQLGTQYLESTDAKYTWTTGIKYEGPFVQSRIEGLGKFSWPDGSSYEGELSGGKRHGQGIYTAADGVTRYEGQWCFGKRHGEGKLTYSVDAGSFYDGGWLHGKKHGFGKQAWPSGNTYEGEWDNGKMQGEGTMTWQIGNTTESYSGHWQDNRPDGQGSHVWHAEGAAADSSPVRVAMPHQQQQLNRYEGQWSSGKREGSGTFYYANGAYYTGEWKDHVKQGHGRHVNEQGLVYEGSFTVDRMEGQHHVPAHRVNKGSEDNPICRSTDLSDLTVFALPADASGVKASFGSGYVEPYKIFREIYNLVLSHLGDLREQYNRYRVVAPKAGAEPFSLLIYQFWLFARDAGIVTPTCSLARINRAVFSGPRHHRDTAPDDVTDLRALTPRLQRRASSRASSVLDNEQGLVGTRPGSVQRPGSTAGFALLERPGSGESMGSGESEEGSLVSSLPSPTNQEGLKAEGESVADDEAGGDGSSVPPKPGTAGGASKPSTAKPGSAATSRSALLRADTVLGIAVDGSVGRKFARPEGVPDLRNIHDPSGALLFRQFIEAFVRCGLARFPQEPGLESQIVQIFKMLPSASSEGPLSEGIFSFLGEKDFQPPLEMFVPELWKLFGGGITPQDTSNDVELPPTLQEVAPQAPAATFTPPVPRTGSLGLPSRQLHVCSRLDVTMRIKDVLRLLDKAGFVRPMTASMLAEDLAGEVFMGAAHEDPFFEPVDEGEGEASAEAGEEGGNNPPENDALGMIDEGKVSKVPTGFLSVLQSSESGEGMSFLPKAGAGLLSRPEEEPSSRRPGRKSSRSRDGGKGSTEEAEAEPKADPNAPPDLSTCDFTLTVIQALRLLAEVLSPDSRSQLRWRVEVADCSPGDERISLLEHLETELVFAEFLRLLVQMADMGTRRNQEMRDSVPLARRFELFLKSVFLPALEKPYLPPAPPAPATEVSSEVASEQPPEKAAEEGAEDAPAAEEGGAPGEEPMEPIEGEAAAAEEDQVLDLWREFGSTAVTSAAVQVCSRAWPQDYDEEL